MSTAIGLIREAEPNLKAQVLVLEPRLGAPLSFARRVPELDGYRGMAVCVALIYHYVRYAIVARPPELLGYVYQGTPLLWAGMEMFFVLSGFLIGGILLDSRESPRFFSTFYIRRFCRILPMYFLYLGLMVLAYRFIYRPVGAPLDWAFSGRMPWYLYFSFGQNWLMARWNMLGPPLLAITWSLAVEEQFYFALPFVIKYVKRSALPYVFLTGIAVAPIVRVLLAHHSRANLWATYVLLPCRMDSLLVGALCAYCVREPKIWRWLVKNRPGLLIGFFGLIAAMPLLSNQGIPFTWLWLSIGIGWMSVFFAVALLLGITDSQGAFSRVMRWKWFASLGAIGYSVYLFHMGIYTFWMYLLTNHGWRLASWKDLGVTFIALVTTLGFCKLLWRYFEKPIASWSHNWRY